MAPNVVDEPITSSEHYANYRNQSIYVNLALDFVNKQTRKTWIVNNLN